MGYELLAQAHNFRQHESEDVFIFASRLDNQIQHAKNHGAELLPNEQAVDRHGGILLSRGPKKRTRLDTERNPGKRSPI